MKTLGIATLALTLTGCSPAGIDPSSWSCTSLIRPTVEMSGGRTPEVLEISNPEELSNIPNYRIECRGNAEWTQGWGMIEYGAHVSEGGSVILEYQQQ